mmetsp:Transcript_11562/g.23368  ORF Transcript_11562/g.23368 Transcript_11562/m.23368 type:complete len:205 (-) Transcript_11562:204-818(-)
MSSSLSSCPISSLVGTPPLRPVLPTSHTGGFSSPSEETLSMSTIESEVATPPERELGRMDLSGPPPPLKPTLSWVDCISSCRLEENLSSAVLISSMTGFLFNSDDGSMRTELGGPDISLARDIEGVGFLPSKLLFSLGGRDSGCWLTSSLSHASWEDEELTAEYRKDNSFGTKESLPPLFFRPIDFAASMRREEPVGLSAIILR